MDSIIPLRIDPEFQSLIPPLTNDEYQRLERSILAEGVRDPLITWDGTIIDGHNRYSICQQHGIQFRTSERTFASRDAAKIWIIENQFGRRNLSTYDRGVLALQLEPLYAAEAKRRMSAGGNSSKVGRQNSDNPIRTDDQIAKLAGTSRDTIRKVKVIETEAAKGNETAIKARDDVKSGEKSIHKAFIEVRPKGNKSDTRPICTICGKPIDGGDSYSHNANKHKSCAMKDTEMHRGSRGGRKGAQYADDGRRICTICGEPIDEGAHYQDKLNWHKSCGKAHELEMQRQYRDADKDLRNNQASYTIESLVMELTSSAEMMKEAIEESIATNESMGVVLTRHQKRMLSGAVNGVFKAIQKIERANNGD